MSRFTHAICTACWRYRTAKAGQPGRVATRVTDAHEEACCFCGASTQAGIYVRENPLGLRCRGEHP
jgi:hypothetical protein